MWLRIGRQLNASVSPYLQVEDLSSIASIL